MATESFPCPPNVTESRYRALIADILVYLAEGKGEDEHIVFHDSQIQCIAEFLLESNIGDASLAVMNMANGQVKRTMERVRKAIQRQRKRASVNVPHIILESLRTEGWVEVVDWRKKRVSILDHNLNPKEIPLCKLLRKPMSMMN